MGQPKKIIMHLGATKCGTTSLQGYLIEYGEALRAQGILRPATMTFGYNDAIAGAYMGMPPAVEKAALAYGEPNIDYDRLCTLIERDLLTEIETSGLHTIILSFEGFLPRTPPQIEKMIRLLRRVTDDIHAVVTVRRHDRWAISSYNTRLVGGGTTTRDMLFKDHKTPQGDPIRHGISYKTHFEYWHRFIPKEKFTVIPFEDHENILTAYLAALGIQGDAPIDVIRNRGLSAYSQEVIRRWNELQKDSRPRSFENKKPNRVLKAILPRGRGKMPSALQVQAHLAHFRDDLDFLRGEYIPEHSKFFDELWTYPDTPTEVTVSDDEVMEWVKKANALAPQIEDGRSNPESQRGIHKPTNWRSIEIVSRGVEASRR